MVNQHAIREGYTFMSILKMNSVLHAVWDNTGGFALFVGTLQQCKDYINEFDRKRAMS